MLQSGRRTLTARLEHVSDSLGRGRRGRIELRLVLEPRSASPQPTYSCAGELHSTQRTEIVGSCSVDKSSRPLFEAIRQRGAIRPVNALEQR